VPTAQDATKIWLADINGDAVPELVVQNPAGVSLRTFRLSIPAESEPQPQPQPQPQPEPEPEPQPEPEPEP
jgi:hypothetical protein